ncbi:unnamed protein product [Orchesella dallaii]|uniref:Coiled-coil domain-containing protein 28B n=1 Tax=Orchesella dallaii TaxID=48710 RepID=A0ABP1RA89_9HEXA
MNLNANSAHTRSHSPGKNFTSSSSPSHSNMARSQIPSCDTNSSSTSPVSTTTVLLRNNLPVTETLSNNHHQKSNNQPVTPAHNPLKQNTTQAYHHNVPTNSNALPGHSFLSAVSEVKTMENALLGLLASFNSGELSAFGSGRTLETMEAIRSKQERLARLHFDLASGGNLDDSTAGKDSTTTPQQTKEKQSSNSTNQSNQNPQAQDKSSTPWMSESDQDKLVAGLRELSVEIEKLHEHENVGKRPSCVNVQPQENN